MHTRNRLVSPIVALVAAAALSACGSDSTAPVQTAVSASLREFAITLDRSSAPQGRVTFNVTNNGTVMHEFLVIRANGPANGLPTHPNGTYDHSDPAAIPFGEIEGIPPGETVSATFDLIAGQYVIICNMFGPFGSHYQLGMRTTFNVSD